MKKSKVILFLIFILFTSGCEAKYRIEIENNKIKEYGNAIFNQNEINNDVETTVKELSGKYFINDDLIISPSTNILIKNNTSIYQTINEYNYSDYKYSALLSLCYDDVKVLNSNQQISIKTSDTFNCFNDYEELKKVTIELHTSQKVTYDNADLKKGNTYYWYITSDNINKNIKFTFYKNKVTNIFKIDIIYLSLIVLGIVFVASLGVYYFMIRKNKNNNKI
ncbi:MAG: hypothetical protein PHN42_04015 [Bacilli bacterium]|nr:hypothetical protein [Bacilli bacterium]